MSADEAGDDAPLPAVSVVMAVRNEELHIEQAVRSVLDQDYPGDRIEVIVADGRSTDRTGAILEALTKDDARLRVVDNPEEIVPTGLNIAIAAATGEVIVRVDGHCDIDPDFVAASVAV